MVSFSLVLSPFFLQLCSIISFAEITDFFFFLESWPLSLGLSGVWIVGMLVNWCSEGKTKPWSVAIGKESACNAGDLGSTSGLGRSPGEGKGYPLQYSGLENSMGCIVHGVAKSGTWLSDFHFHFIFLVSVLHHLRSVPSYWCDVLECGRVRARVFWWAGTISASAPVLANSLPVGAESPATWKVGRPLPLRKPKVKYIPSPQS